jgi:dTDP-4-amino-4,6-dideoxygalactose transaminase
MGSTLFDPARSVVSPPGPDPAGLGRRSSRVPFVDLGPLHAALADQLRDAFERVLASGRFTAGPEVERFEAALAARVGVRHAAAVGSGTAALHLCLLAAGVGAGDEVIVPANTFFATVEAVMATGATPVFADVDRRTAGLDPDSVAALLSARTAAVVAVHLYGHPVDFDALRRAVPGHQLLLVEDAAQAMGSRWAGAEVGSLGDAAGFSFYPSKNLGALGEAGAVTTDDPSLAGAVRALRSHGEVTKNVHESSAFNERPDELQAAFLNVKLAHLDEALRCRRELVSHYLRLLADVDGVEPIGSPPGADPALHLLVVRVPERDRVLRALRRSGVEAAVHYPTPVHLQPACRRLGGRPGQLPVAEELAGSVLSLPLFVGMTHAQVERCVDVLAEAVGRP